MRNSSPLMRDSFMIVLLHKINYKLNSDTHSQFTYETTIMLEGQQKIKGYGLRNCHPKSALKPAQQLANAVSNCEGAKYIPCSSIPLYYLSNFAVSLFFASHHKSHALPFSQHQMYIEQEYL